MLLDTGSGCASPLSIDGVAFGVGTWSTSRVSTVQVGQTVLDRYIALLALALVLATASGTPRTTLPMLLLVWITGAGLQL